MSTDVSHRRLSPPFRRLLDSLPTGFVLVDPEGRIAHVNPEAARLLGEEGPKECVGLTLHEVFPDLPPERAPFEVSENETWNRIAWPRNRHRVAGALDLGARHCDDWLPGCILVALSPATGDAELPGPEAVRRPGQAEAALEESARGMSHILDGIFDLARMQGGALEPAREEYSVPDLVESVAFALGGRAAQKRLEVSVEVEPTLPWLLLGDARLVRQLLTNLGANAIEFTERGGVHLAARTGQTREDGEVDVVLEVRDTGPGIAPELLGRIFEPFVQGPDAATTRTGSGLGLAVVRGTVDRMGGRVEVESARGRGSTFRLVIPHGSSPRPCPGRRLSDRAWPDTAVLVSGGSAELHDGIKSAVEHMGSRLQLASPERLLDHIRSAGVPRVLVLLDHSLGHARVARLAAAARAAARSATRIEVVVLVPPGSDGWVDAAGRPLPYLLKPVVRRRLAVFMSPDPALAAVSVEEGPKRILVVEDDYGIRVFYEQFLPRILEAEVVEAATVKEALAALAPPPRLAIVDLSLPDGEGTEVARVIRERWGRDVLVVATSGYDESRIEPLLRDGTFDAFLPKPSPLDQIETLLGDLLSRSPTRTSALALSGS